MKQVVLKQHAVGEISTDNFEVVTKPIPKIEDGEFYIQNFVCGTDPYMRISMNPVETFPNYPMVELGEGIPGETVGIVVESKNKDFPVGTYLWHKLGWRTHAVGNSNTEHFKLNIQGDRVEFAKRYLTLFSLVSKTAYYSLTRVLKIKESDVVCVSGATGGVGNMVVQFANLMGAKVYGITSTDEKAKLVEDLGGTGIVVPRKTNLAGIQTILKEYGPFDAYHENVGNDYFFSALQNMSYSGRMSYCGVMSLYQNVMPTPGPNLFALTVKDVTIRGCNMTKDYAYGSEEWKRQFDWISEFEQFVTDNIDSLKCINSTYSGIEAMPKQFVDHFTPKDPVSGKSLCELN
tara:strand:- start:251 stop:1291 length:1041 start_codon:yes stop_codon:yes gene_type:complete